VRPARKGEFGLFLADGNWYRLRLLSEPDPHDPVKSLDVSVLQDRVLGPLLGIRDPKEDPRISFIGGIRGLGELERRVTGGSDMAAFSMYQTSMEELFAVADAGELMPPKSTWFEPKLLSGLFSDHLGIKKVALASACFAGVCSIVSVATHSAGFAYAGVFASSMLVPIIVWTATRLLAGTKGLALGMVNMLTGVSVLVIAAGEFTLGVMVMAVFVTVVAVFVTIGVNRTEHAH
jgi:hypothetical protein